MEHNHNNNTQHLAHGHSYMGLLYMVLLSFIAMYILMYSMVDTFDNIIPNINQLYMAGLMTAPMVPIELLLMRRMYTNRKRNLIVCVSAVLAGAACFFLIRTQGAVRDEEFLKSMIPHHGAAVLMVKEAQLEDPEVQELARKIIIAQEEEIRQMKQKIKEFENNR